VRSPSILRTALTALFLATSLATNAGAADTTAATTAAASAGTTAEGPLTREEIRAAVSQLAADPNLSGEQKTHQLRWIRSGAPPPADTPSWTRGFFDFLARSLSILLWTAGMAGAAYALIWVIRWLRSLPPMVEPGPPTPVGSVSGLDIRPASLPEDIGAAALALAEEQRTREALSLLYRGALSRAVHRYGAAIGASFTEGEALRAANARLDPSRAQYVADLVSVWQRTVYAGETATRETVERLCRRFAPAMDGAAA
jgi:Domain of unknown function (DUF4129)